jgi:hypothetical protein
MGEWTFKDADGTDHTLMAPSREEALNAFVSTYGGAKSQKQIMKDTADTEIGMLKQGGARVLHTGASMIGQMLGGPDLNDKAKAAVQKGMDDPGIGGKISRALSYLPGGDPAHRVVTPDHAAALMSKLTGGYSDRQPQNVGEEYAGTGGDFLAASALTGGLGGLIPMMRNAVLPAITSETAGQVARKVADKVPRPDWMPKWMPSLESTARFVGAAASPAVEATARGVITPNPTDIARKQAADAFDKEGMRYSAGQKVDSAALRYAEASTGRPAEQLVKGQAEDFTRQSLARIGVKADRGLPDVMKPAARGIQSKLDTLSAGTDIIPNSVPQLQTDMANTTQWYKAQPGPHGSAIESIANDANKYISQTGQISGSQYQALTSRLRELTSGTKNSDYAQAAGKLRQALDSAMESSLAINAPEKLGEWRATNSRYRDLVAIERSLAEGAQGDEGLIDPAKLRQVTTQQAGRRVAVQGSRDLGELARVGKIMMEKLPNSGTAPRMAAGFGLLPAIAKVSAGAGPGVALGNTLLPGGVGALIGGTIGGGVVPALEKLYKAGIMSKPGQKYLGNQLLQPRGKTGADNMQGLIRLMQMYQDPPRGGGAH